jgi:hypothetical protein
MSRFAQRLARSRWAQAASGLLLWAGGTFGGQVLGQMPEPAGATVPRSSVPPYHLNKRTIQLPIQLDDKYRPMLQEIQLWIKETPSAPWTLREKAPPTQTAFTFQAPRDGEFWFTMVTVDRKGKSVPADVSKEEPAMAVVVDTQPPQLDLLMLGSVPEGQLVQCDVRDAHPDVAKTRMQYQTADKLFRDLEPLADRPNVWCIPAQANITGQIRFCASDMAGNLATRECTVAQLPAPVQTAQHTQPALPTGVLPGAPLIWPAQPPGAGLPAAPTVEPRATMPPAEKSAGPALLPGNLGASPVLANTAPNSVPQGTVPQGAPPQETVSYRPDGQAPLIKQAGATGDLPDGPQIVPGVAPGGPALNSAAPANANRETVPQLLVNGTRLFLEYKIEQAGPSGVGRVEVWCTRDKGQTWKKIGEEQGRQSPAEVHLPGDGEYGLTLVVSNGFGFGAQPPATGDSPDWYVEVDTTKPTAQFTTVKLTPEDGPSVHIAWTSKDRNLGTGPVELSYALKRQGPWLPIAKGLSGEGTHRWAPLTDIGAHAFLRLTVRDLAGNTTITETTQPVSLDDLSRPRAHIAGVRTDAGLVSAPNANAH